MNANFDLVEFNRNSILMIILSTTAKGYNTEGSLLAVNYNLQNINNYIT